MKKLALIIAAVLTCVSVAGAATPREPFVLDAIVSTTGSAGFFGEQAVAAFKAAENEINAEGGIRGQPVHFEMHDDGSDPKIAIQLANAILAKHPAAFFGGTVQGTCSAVAAIVTNGPVDYCVSPGLIPTAHGYVFSSFSALTHVLPAQFRYLRTSGKLRIGMLVSTDATGQRSDQMLDFTLHLPENSPLVVVAHEHFNPTDLSVSAQLARIKAADPQVFYVSAAGTPFQTVMRGVIDAGMLQVPIITSSSNMTLQTLNAWVKTPPKQLLFNGPRFYGTIPDVDPRVRAAVAKYRAAMKRIGADPSANDAFYWDPALIIVDALRKVGPDATATQLHEYLEQLHDYVGIAGVYDFRGGDQHGLGDEATVILQWDPPKGSFFPVSAPGGTALKR